MCKSITCFQSSIRHKSTRYLYFALMWTEPKRLVFYAFLIFFLTACGGARSPEFGDRASATDIISVSSSSYITWIPPSKYQDESPLSLSDIAGYQIYAGTSRDKLYLNTNILDSSITSFKLDKLGKGLRYITITCYDTEGVESNFSKVLVLYII